MKHLLIATFLLFSLALSNADFARAEKAIHLHSELVKAWEASIIGVTDSETLQQKISNRPNPQTTSRILMREISSQLSDPKALSAINWIYKNNPSFLSDKKETSPGALIRSSLKRHHYKTPGVGELCMTISQAFSPQDMSFLEKVASQSPSPEDQGLASLALSTALSSLGDTPEIISDRLTHLKKAIQLIPSSSTVADMKATDIISDQIYVITNLSKGRKAPSFSGFDLGGREITSTLSSGKVTAICFWSETDISQNTYLDIIADTAQLLEENNGKMIGVYSGDRTPLLPLTQDRKITWPNIVDQDNAITNQFRISKSPTIFLLDKSGKIQSISEPNALVNLSIRALSEISE